ncbi:MAG: DNA helicase RecG, partial [Chloroflexota bacterium]
AEEDLKLRGPGEFFGTRQSGLPDLRMAKLSDVALLEMARREAVRIFEEDPGLRQEAHLPMRAAVARAWPKAAEWS